MITVLTKKLSDHFFCISLQYETYILSRNAARRDAGRLHKQ